MTKFFLSLHVVAAILLIGPLAVVTSIFPRYAGSLSAGAANRSVAVKLHQVTRTYGVLALAVPALGIATAGKMNVLANAWLIASMTLAVIAAGILVALILPHQRRMLQTDPAHPPTMAVTTMRRRLAAAVGIFNLIWLVVVVLMVARPGSTAGA